MSTQMLLIRGNFQLCSSKMFFCAISGEAPLDPVVSNKSGHVYERRLILKYISENGTDPLTGEKLEESDLVSVKASKLSTTSHLSTLTTYKDPNTAPPRLPTQSSIPILLHTLQNEWDALVLEMFVLKQQYNLTRQELSYALYAQDAATRVIARLIKERDAAREYGPRKIPGADRATAFRTPRPAQRHA